MVVIDPSLVYENENNLDIHTKLVCGWKHNQKYTKSSLRSCTYIITHKCKKVESKLLQSLSNHWGAKYWVYNMLYTNEICKCTKNNSKIFLKLTNKIVLKNIFTLKNLIYYYFYFESWKCRKKF